MMKQNVRWKVLFTCMMALLLLLCSGCGNKATKSTEHEPITLCNLYELLSPHFFEKVQEACPDVNLEPTFYKGKNGSGYALATLEHGDIPDIYLSTQFFSPEKQKEYLLDLSGYDFINNYSTTMLNEIDNDGSIYLIPCNFMLVGIAYNKTILEENGWELPNSLEELEALAPKIEAAGYKTVTCASGLEGYPFNYFFNIGNTTYFSTAAGAEWKRDFSQGKAKAAGNEELLEAAEYFKRWVDNGFITLPKDPDDVFSEDQFLRGESVFYLSLGLQKFSYTKEDGTVYEFGVMPWLSEDGSQNMLTRDMKLYFGINKELAEKGNEQKLEDALKVLSFITSDEGQEALVDNQDNAVLFNSPLAGSQVPEKSPYYHLNHLVKSGNTVQLVYVGWESLIVPIARDIQMLINGEITPEQLLEEFDKSYAEVASGGDEGVLGVVETDLTLEETTKLVANAMGIATDADAAIVSLGCYYAGGKGNPHGVPWHLYAGNIGTEQVNMVRNDGTSMYVLELTGAEIKSLAEGGFDLYNNGHPFTYVLHTKGDMELDDDTMYKLVMGANELTDAWTEKATTVELSPKDAIMEYVSALGTFGPEDISWN